MDDHGRPVVPAELLARAGLTEGTPRVFIETPGGVLLAGPEQLSALVRADLAGSTWSANCLPIGARPPPTTRRERSNASASLAFLHRACVPPASLRSSSELAFLQRDRAAPSSDVRPDPCYD